MWFIHRVDGRTDVRSCSAVRRRLGHSHCTYGVTLSISHGVGGDVIDLVFYDAFENAQCNPVGRPTAARITEDLDLDFIPVNEPDAGK